MFSWLKKKQMPNTQMQTMKREINFNDNDAKVLLQNIKREFGLDYEKQEYITFRKLERFAIKNDICDFKELQTKIDESKELQTKLINMLTVGETYFYREMGHFKILASFMDEKKIENILCAPSSSGEEVYSILLYLQESCGKKVNITGLDLNSDAIEMAKKGCYSQRSLSKLPADLRKKYFHADADKECISQEFKQRTTFLHQNIFNDSIKKLGTFDAIFCRNMLIYFDYEEKVKAILQLASLLKSGGLLFIGHADISFTPDNFIKQFSKDGNYFVKI